MPYDQTPAAQPLASLSVRQAAVITTACGPLNVFNANALAATANPTNPYAALAGTSTNHGNVIVQPAPRGVNYLDLFLIGDAAPTTTPVVRVFGRLPAVRESKAPQPDPKAIAAALYRPDGDWWMPLPTIDGDYAVKLDGASAPPLVTAADRWSTPVTIQVRGADAVIVLVETAASGTIAAGVVAGIFGV